MIRALLRRLILGAAGGAALSASAAVFVVALAFALYALVEPRVGAAGAAAIVAGAAAVIIAVGAAILFSAARPRTSKAVKASSASVEGVAERALTFFKENPLLTVGAALGVGFMAIRNPGYLGAAIRSFIEGRELPKAKR